MYPVKGVKDDLKNKQLAQKKYYDSQPILVQNGIRDWKSGVVVNRTDEDYTVRVGKGEYRRNRSHLRPFYTPTSSTTKQESEAATELAINIEPLNPQEDCQEASLLNKKSSDCLKNSTMIKPVEYYKFVVKSLADPRTQNWFLISEPWQLVSIILLYLYAVYKFLPAYMLNKEPYTLKKIIGAYNIFQIIACIFLIYGVSTSGWITDYSLGCQVVDYSENEMPLRMAKFMWWHMIVKMCELLETCFFVLRKKTNQVTFLHVYHHISTLILAWIACKYFPGGMITFTVLLNSFIHIIMYGYYFLTALGPTMRKKMDIVKSKLTILQLIQLGIILIHSVQMILPGCEIPNAAGYIYLPNMVINILLFLNFYKRSYSKKLK
ncbi:hypothetical protein RN001_008707 [Aquatica leii]|uniref:Elongation of very long chain fatty acids protein n=1 Tax=Aquatica leii TaxID=1421715 RepID=A0AAN7S9T7_9COLE|nr:hypothetical protein RN001_008707 [Aquatica leii]